MLKDSASNQVGRRLGNLSDLPESVRSQLSRAVLLEMQAIVSKAAPLKTQIIDIIRELGGIAFINEISVKLHQSNTGRQIAPVSICKTSACST